jgi:ribose transport system substrate-binding protein
MWRGYALAAALGACIALSGGCGGCGDSQPAAKYKIAVIPKGLTHEFWQSVHRGAEQAGRDSTEQGISTQILWDGPYKEDDAKDQIDLIQVMLSKKVNGIVLAPQHSETMVDPVKRAVRQGVPVVVIDSGLNAEDEIVKYIATDNYHGGEVAAENLLRILREEGTTAPKLVLFRYAVGSESTEKREKGFIDFVEKEIKKQEEAGVNEDERIRWLSKDQYAGATKETAKDAAAPLINRLRERGIDGIFAVNESAAAGMLSALRSQKNKIPNKVHFVGFDSSDDLLQGLEAGDIDGLVVQDPYKMGYLGVWTMVQYLEGFDVTPQGKREGTGENWVTKANLNDKCTRELFEPDLQKARTIKPEPFTKKR